MDNSKGEIKVTNTANGSRLKNQGLRIITGSDTNLMIQGRGL